jgi:hypothetical protein
MYQKQIDNSFCFFWDNCTRDAKMVRNYTYNGLEIVGLGGNTFKLSLGPGETSFIECEIIED